MSQPWWELPAAWYTFFGLVLVLVPSEEVQANHARVDPHAKASSPATMASTRSLCLQIEA